jgi:hypothetical protein
MQKANKIGSRFWDFYFTGIFTGAAVGSVGTGSWYGFETLKQTQGGSFPYRIVNSSSAFIFGGVLGFFVGGISVAFSPVIVPLFLKEYYELKERTEKINE